MPTANTSPSFLPILVAGGGIGGLAAALALARQGLRVSVLEQAANLAEIGAGIQLGPNAFVALDALGIGARVRARGVHAERLMMMDAIDEAEIASIPLGQAFFTRFGHPYAVIHRADVHQSLLEGVQETGLVELHTATAVAQIEQTPEAVVVVDRSGHTHRGAALVGCDGVKSTVRQRYVSDPVRVSGHVVYRAVVD